jgi:hypothetical protein
MAAPIIDTQPVSSAYIVSDAKTLSVIAHPATAGHTLTYQWKKNGTNISAATTSTLSFAALAIADAGSYTCVVTDGPDSATSAAAVLTLDSIVAHVTRNRKDLLAGMSTGAGDLFTPAKVDEERLFFGIGGNYPYILLLKAPIEPGEENNKKEEVKIQFMVCYFDDYNDEPETDGTIKEEITSYFRNIAAEITRKWMTDRTCGGLMEGTRKLSEDQGIATDDKGNSCYRVDVVFEVFGFIDSDNPFLKG